MDVSLAVEIRQPIDCGMVETTQGRPEKYSTHVEPYLTQIQQWLQEGMTEYSIAEQLGIARQTYYEYKKKYSDLQDVHTRAREEKNCLVMHRMYSKAVGERITLDKKKVTGKGDVIDYTEDQYLPPDVNAADLYLRNNNPNYKAAKDMGNMTLNQYNFQLPDVQANITKLQERLKYLKSLDITDVEVIEDEPK